MIKVKDLAIELSIKLGDPRTDAGDGILFYSEDRLRYLSRGYGKLVRVLSMAMRKYKPGFVLPLIPFNLKGDPGNVGGGNLTKGPYTFDKPFITIEEVIVTTAGKSSKKELTSKLVAANYNQAKFGLDETNKPSASNIFYTVMSNKLYILPDGDDLYKEIDAMGVEDIGVFKIEDNVPIDRTYVDMLITFAAIEAMNDLPNSQKVQLYRGELIDQVSVIANYTNLMERNEGDIGNG